MSRSFNTALVPAASGSLTELLEETTDGLKQRLEEKLAKLKQQPKKVTATDVVEAFAVLIEAYSKHPVLPLEMFTKAVNDYLGFYLLQYESPVEERKEDECRRIGQSNMFEHSPYTFFGEPEMLNIEGLRFYDVTLVTCLQNLASRRGPSSLADKVKLLDESRIGYRLSPSLTQKLFDEIVQNHGQWDGSEVLLVEPGGKALHSAYPLPPNNLFLAICAVPISVAGQKMYAVPEFQHITSGPFVRVAVENGGERLIGFRPLQPVSHIWDKNDLKKDAT